MFEVWLSIPEEEKRALLKRNAPDGLRVIREIFEQVEYLRIRPNPTWIGMKQIFNVIIRTVENKGTNWFKTEYSIDCVFDDLENEELRVPAGIKRQVKIRISKLEGYFSYQTGGF